MNTFLKHIVTEHTWDNLHLGKETISELKEIADQIQTGQRGIALFVGPPGTGKTIASGVLASAQGLDLFRVDLASLVSKYIGETEKNLAGLFEQSQESAGMLLFDEADALFGKRSEVKDAHDRFANIDSNYLLESIEGFAGVVILTSNLRSNFDDAFLRRMAWIIEFTKPEPQLTWWQRLLKWMGLK